MRDFITFTRRTEVNLILPKVLNLKRETLNAERLISKLNSDITCLITTFLYS